MGLDEAELAAFRSPAVTKLLAAGNSNAVRMRIAALLHDSLESGDFGNWGLGDETLDMVREQFAKIADDHSEAAHGWHRRDELIPLEVIEQISEYKVQRIEKDTFGLSWGEIGIEPAPGYPVIWLYRLPGYFPEVPDGEAFVNYIGTLFATGSSIASLDKLVLFMASEPPKPVLAGLIVEALHDYGFQVLVYTVADQGEWWFVSTAGADGIFVDDIPMGLMMEGN